jgi:hypothetical protein
MQACHYERIHSLIVFHRPETRFPTWEHEPALNITGSVPMYADWYTSFWTIGVPSNVFCNSVEQNLSWEVASCSAD